MQSTAYEAASQLIHLLLCPEEEEEDDTNMVKDALKLPLSLMGNCFASSSQKWSRTILVGIHS